MGFNLTNISGVGTPHFSAKAQCSKTDNPNWNAVSADSFQRVSRPKFSGGGQKPVANSSFKWLKKTASSAAKTLRQEARFFVSDMENLKNDAKATVKKIGEDPNKVGGVGAAAGFVIDCTFWGGLPLMAATTGTLTRYAAQMDKEEPSQYASSYDDATEASSSLGSETEAQRRLRALFLSPRDSSSEEGQTDDALDNVHELFEQTSTPEEADVPISNKTSTETTSSLESDTSAAGSKTSTNPFDDENLLAEIMRTKGAQQAGDDLSWLQL